MTADWDASSVEIKSQRLRLKLFTAVDADEVFAAITPAITRFMQWEPPRSSTAFAEVWRSWLAPILEGSDPFCCALTGGRSLSGTCRPSRGKDGLARNRNLDKGGRPWKRHRPGGRRRRGGMGVRGTRSGWLRISCRRREYGEPKNCGRPWRFNRRDALQSEIHLGRLSSPQSQALMRQGGRPLDPNRRGHA